MKILTRRELDELRVEKILVLRFNMKKVIVTILFIILMLFAFKSDSEVTTNTIVKTTLQQHIFNHQTFGVYQSGAYGITGGVKRFDSYAQNFQTNTGYRYRYEIYMCSRTYNNYGQYRNTNVYGSHISVNNQNITMAQYPYGLNYTASVAGTMIYVWETNDPRVNFNVNWQRLQ